MLCVQNLLSCLQRDGKLWTVVLAMTVFERVGFQIAGSRPAPPLPLNFHKIRENTTDEDSDIMGSRIGGFEPQLGSLLLATLHRSNYKRRTRTGAHRRGFLACVTTASRTCALSAFERLNCLGRRSHKSPPTCVMRPLVFV